jgi:hypothetical protein
MDNIAAVSKPYLQQIPLFPLTNKNDKYALQSPQLKTRKLYGTIDINNELVNIFTVFIYTESNFDGEPIFYKPGDYTYSDKEIKSIIIPPRVVVTFFTYDNGQRKIATFYDSQKNITLTDPVTFMLIQACKHPCYIDNNNEITVYQEKSESNRIHIFYSLLTYESFDP